MATQSQVLQKLIAAAYAGPVFGKDVSFGADATARLGDIAGQIAAIAGICNADLQQCVQQAIPEYTPKDVVRILGEIAPKAVSFCPALAAGELLGDANTKRLASAASAIGTMYFADQTMDRGDEAMVLAIEKLCGDQPKIPAKLAAGVASRLAALGDIKRHIDDLALPEDAPFVLDCYDQQVLYNEVGMHRLSAAYKALPKQKQPAFLSEHSAQAARFLVADAGLPSVSAPLYAIYRQNDNSLPPLSEVHGDSTMKAFLQMCNAVARIGDEVGDWWVDAGNDPAWGVFSLNPFNHYHPSFVGELCDLAGMSDQQQVAKLQQAFKDFHTSEGARKKYTTEIPALFFAHARQYTADLPPAFRKKYGLYITLCMRVLEIAHVNMIGDIALAGK